jgi:hypothetical protein
MSRQNLTVIRGNDDTLTVTLTGLPEGGIIDAWFTVAGLFEKRLGDGLTIDDPEEGDCTVTLTPADTDGAPPSRVAYPFDLQVELADGGGIKTPVRGRFIVLPDTTTRIT